MLAGSLICLPTGKVLVVGSSEDSTTGRDRVATAIYTSDGSEIDKRRHDQFADLPGHGGGDLTHPLPPQRGQVRARGL